MKRHSKLVLNFALGRRNQETTDVFIESLREDQRTFRTLPGNGPL